jgi:acetyltransferase-like isoleucine patch superfamily enzyme
LIEEKVRLLGNVKLGFGVSIGMYAELNGRDSLITIGDRCDIASFVTITTADSHKQCIGLADKNERKPVVLEERIFVGQGAIILPGSHIGHHSVIGAGAVVRGEIPPYSRVRAPGAVVEPGFYQR